jgi:hypothetical protein
MTETATASDRTPKKPTRPKRVTCPDCRATFDPVKAGKPRSPDQHKRFWGVVQAALQHWPESHDRQFSDHHECRHYLTMKAGWRDIAAIIPLAGIKPATATTLATAAMKAAGTYCVAGAHAGSIVIWKPRSISFQNMGHMEFVALNSAVDDVLKAEIGLTGGELLQRNKDNI